MHIHARGVHTVVTNFVLQSMYRATDSTFTVCLEVRYIVRIYTADSNPDSNPDYANPDYDLD